MLKVKCNNDIITYFLEYFEGKSEGGLEKEKY